MKKDQRIRRIRGIQDPARQRRHAENRVRGPAARATRLSAAFFIGEAGQNPRNPHRHMHAKNLNGKGLDD